MNEDNIGIIGAGHIGKTTAGLISTDLGRPILVIANDNEDLRNTTTEIVSLNQFQAPVIQWSEPMFKKKRGSNFTPKKKKRK